MGALIIFPAAMAKRLGRNLSGMLQLAVLVAVFATLAGTWIAAHLQKETGPLIVTVAAGTFLISLFAPAGMRAPAKAEEERRNAGQFQLLRFIKS